jgi:hypothetical protein
MLHFVVNSPTGFKGLSLGGRSEVVQVGLEKPECLGYCSAVDLPKHNGVDENQPEVQRQQTPHINRARTPPEP